LGEVRVGQYIVNISNVDKVMFPEDGITKGDLVEYYMRIAETMVPHMEGRPISMQRFPEGIHGEWFFEKEAPEYFPDWITRVRVEKKEGGSQYQIVVDKAATLAYLANQACITPHIWLSRADRIHNPDKMIFDLDPPDGSFEPVREAATHLREVLEGVGLVPFVMTTGSRGLHVVVPLDRGEGFDSVRGFSQHVAERLSRENPDRFTTEGRIEKRGGRLFLDTMRNAYAQTSVSPYAVRARPGAPVATPLEWDELEDRSLNSQSYNVGNIFRRLGQKQDPWRGIMKHARSLDEPRRLLGPPSKEA
jgi:bifunctional non-homologous end joining protein LigD